MFKKVIYNFVFNKVFNKVHNFYLSVNLKTRELILTADDKCLCIAPHSDDESIGCGGTLSKYPKNFDVICLTQSRKINDKRDEINEDSTRSIEFKNAMNKADVDSHKILKLKDKEVLCDYEKFSSIDISKYDYVFIPNILDQHSDHKAISLLLKRLIKNKPHKKGLKIAFYEVWSALAVPNSYINISGFIEKKKELINSHVSQIATRDYTNKAVSLNAYRGLPHNINYAEAFCLVDISTFLKMCKII